MHRRAAAALGGEEVTLLLDPEGGDDDAPDADRPSPRERLGVHPGTGDDDRAGHADIDVLRAQLTVRARRDLELAPRRTGEGRAADDGVRGGPDRHAGARADLVDDARHRRLERLRAFPARDAPAPAASEQQLAVGGAMRLAGGAATRRGPAVAGRGLVALAVLARDDDRARLAVVLEDRLAAADRLALLHQRPVARVKAEERIDRREQQPPARHELQAGRVRHPYAAGSVRSGHHQAPAPGFIGDPMAVIARRPARRARPRRPAPPAGGRDARADAAARHAGRR